MKNKVFIISMIVFWILLIIVLTVILCSGLKWGNIGWYVNDEENTVIFEKSYDIEQINNIKVLSNAGDVKFKESSNDSEIKVVIYGQTDENVKVELQNYLLTVDNTQYKNKHVSFALKKYINEIEVYVPKSYNKEINLELDYGSIEMTDLENATVTIDENCGDINVGKVKNITLRNDYGDTDIDSVLNKLDIEMNCGDLDIEHLDLKENSTIRCDLGDVSIGSTNDIFIDTSVDLGDSKVKNNNRYAEVTLKIEMNCGDIDVEN